MKRIAPMIFCLAVLATPLRADVTGPPAPGTEVPAATAQSAQGGNADDLAARMALDREESRSLTPARPAPSPAAPAAGFSPSSGLGSFLGMGLSAALLALGLVLGWSQRKLVLGILRPRSAPSRHEPAAEPAPALRPLRALRGASIPRPAATVPAAGADAEALRQLATELRQMMAELKAERARREREWEEREMQWFRRRQREESAAHPAAATRPAMEFASPGIEMPAAAAVVAELESSALPMLGASGDEAAETGLLSRVERLLQQGLSAEEVSRRLRVGLREIQWMMRVRATVAG